MQNLKKPLTLSLLALLVFATVVISTHARREVGKTQALVCENLRETFTSTTLGQIPEHTNAKALYAYNFSNGVVIYSHNADIPLPLASLTKLMTIRVALKDTSTKRAYTLKEQDLRPLGTIGFTAGETYTLEDLASAALIASSNDAALALVGSTGMSQEEFLLEMHAEAERLSLRSFSFATITGLDDMDNNSRAFGNAKDALFLLHADTVDLPTTFKESAEESKSIFSQEGARIELQNTNKFISEFPLLVAGKTGYTDSAGGNLAIIWKEIDGTMLGAVVLGSSQDGRFDQMKLLYDTSRQYVSYMTSLPSFCNNERA